MKKKIFLIIAIFSFIYEISFAQAPNDLGLQPAGQEAEQGYCVKCAIENAKSFSIEAGKLVQDAARKSKQKEGQKQEGAEAPIGEGGE